MIVTVDALGLGEEFTLWLKYPVFTLHIDTEQGVIDIHTSYNKLSELRKLINKKLHEFDKIRKVKLREG